MPTFAELTAEWLETWSAKKSEHYVGTVKNRLDRDILPAIGHQASKATASALMAIF
jgi:hypothetical protein